MSISTVSLALNKPQRVAESTRSRVFDAVTQLDFQPKAAASIQARRGFGRIAVIAPFSAHASFYRRLNGIMSASEGQDIDVVIYDHPSVDTMTSPLLTSLPLRGSVDGLIVMGIPLDSERFHTTTTIPIVVVDFEHPSYDSVLVGDIAGGEVAGAHLADTGCVDFCFIGETQASSGYQSPRSSRLQGFQAALTAVGYNLDDSNVAIVSPDDEAAAVSTIVALLGQLRRPIGVLAYNDHVAALTMQACRRAGLSVPDDVRIVGFDNSEVAMAFGITSLQVPFFDSGRYAFEIMARRLSEPDQPIQYTRLGQQIVVRQSTTA